MQREKLYNLNKTAYFIVVLLCRGDLLLCSSYMCYGIRKGTCRVSVNNHVRTMEKQSHRIFLHFENKKCI